MKALKIVGGVVALLAVAAGAWWFYMGGFAPVTTGRGIIGPFDVVYTVHRGPYQEIGKAWEKMLSDLKTAGFTTCNGLAIYLDPPDTPPENLRSIIGCELSTAGADQRAAIASFKTAPLPAMEAVTSEFPYKNMMSYMVGPMKVYPALHDAISKSGGNPSVTIEVYGDVAAVKSIKFYMPINGDRAAFEAWTQP